MRVVVIGAGPGGACLANGLQHAGNEVEVLERGEHAGARRLGYRVNLNEQGRVALERCLDDDGRRALGAVIHHQTNPVMTVRSADGRMIESRRAPGEDHVAVDRTALQEILIRGIADRVRWRSSVTGLDLPSAPEDSSPARVRVAESPTVEADVVVGADGTSSVIRQALLPNTRPKRFGLTAIYGRTPLSRLDLSGELVREALSSRVTTVVGETGERLVLGAWNPGPAAREVVSDADPYMMWVLLAPATLPAGDAPAAILEFVLDTLAGWMAEPRAIVSAAEPANSFPVPLFCPEVVPPWPAGRVTLIGDAAHPMSPAGGQGANLALADAASLARVLTAANRDPCRLWSLLHRHDQQLRRRATAILADPPAANAHSVHSHNEKEQRA